MMNKFGMCSVAVYLALSIGMTGVAHADVFGMKVGDADASGTVTGSAGPDGGQNAAPQLEKCDRPLGKIAIHEPQDEFTKLLASVKLPSPSSLIRMMVQQSGCFLVVERGQAMQNLMQERALAEGGQVRGGSNMGKGQMAVADYVMTPEVVFSNPKAGGGMAGIGGLFGPAGAIVGGLLGSMNTKEAQTTLLVADVRSGVQVAAAQGSASKTDWALGGVLGAAGGVGGLGAYGNTAEGKVVAAAFLDAYNGVVKAIRGAMPELTRDGRTGREEARTVTKAGVVFSEGDSLGAKLPKVPVRSRADKGGKVVGQFKKTDDAVTDGRIENGYVFVTGEGFEGWVDKNLVVRKN